MKRTYAVIVLDESGSMLEDRRTTLSGFNEQLQSLRSMSAGDHEVFLTLITFNDHVRVIAEKMNVQGFEPLTEQRYYPSGGTALYDAMQEGISRLTSQMVGAGPEDAAIMLTSTDGEENVSRNVKNPDVLKAQIKVLQDSEKYTFTFMGKGDLDRIAATYAIPKGNVERYQDAHLWSASNSAGFTSYATARSVGQTKMMDFYSEPSNLSKK